MKARIAKKIVSPLMVGIYLDDVKMAHKVAGRSAKSWRLKVALLMMKQMGYKEGRADCRVCVAIAKILRRASKYKDE